MLRLKNILVLVLLFLLTAVIIIMPIFFNSLGFEYSYNKKAFWDYSAQTNSTLTSEQVIDFYNNSFQSGNFNVAGNYDDETMKTNTLELLDLVFKDNAEICEHMKKSVKNGTKRFSQEYYLDSVDNSPNILSTISVVLYGEDEYIEFTYESKTKILISFSYDKMNKGVNITELQNALSRYYKNKLKLSDNQFFSESDKLHIYYTLWNKAYKKLEDKAEIDS